MPQFCLISALNHISSELDSTSLPIFSCSTIVVSDIKTALLLLNRSTRLAFDVNVWHYTVVHPQSQLLILRQNHDLSPLHSKTKRHSLFAAPPLSRDWILQLVRLTWSIWRLCWTQVLFFVACGTHCYYIKCLWCWISFIWGGEIWRF